ncbi:GlcG/HbpS family heme-binding protein [Haloarcula sp. GH36]|uniref:GlcG/HbpS family heme-binding protein n=1 Tax=Haloarcula montana TaxID=3111776 RepID=UPI002D77A532|nr:heme-binding protein [Haloarcula sp. GH36]
MVQSIALETATDVIEAAERKAEEIDNPMVVTVANSEGNLVAQHRMDGAWLASVSISRNKAYTAAALETPTHELAEPSEPGNSLYGLQSTDEGRIVIFGGGYPLERDGEIVGTIGVSGGAVSQDREVAEAGVERWEELQA